MSTTYPTDVKVYIDDEDITYWIFGVDSIDITDSNYRFKDIDISPFCSSPGEHTLEITCATGVGRVEARLEMR